MKRLVLGKRFGALIVAFALFAGAFPCSSASAAADANDEYVVISTYLDEKYSEIENYADAGSYADYLAAAEKSGARDASSEIAVLGKDYSRADGMSVSVNENGVNTDERGSIEWVAEIGETALYCIDVTYFPVEGRSADIRRAVLIDGKLPFSEAAAVEFPRVWTNASAIDVKDTQGNDLKPRQVEAPRLAAESVRDHQDYYKEPFKFLLTKGTHTITFVSSREPMAVKAITLKGAAVTPSYAERAAEYASRGYREVSGAVVAVQAETAEFKSSPMLYPLSDRSSPAVSPYNAKTVLNNTIGGNNWAQSGQWVEWDVTVPEDGLYKIALNVKQNFVRGAKVYRRLTVDGSIPFAEAAEIGFSFGKDWRVETLGGGGGDWLFYLTKGTHTLRLTAVLGEMREYARRVEKMIKELNDIYRHVVMVTSTEPDRFRDYQIERKMPGLAASLAAYGAELYQMYDELVVLAKGKGQRDAILNTMAQQLVYLSKDAEKFTSRLQMFKTNVGAMGTWLMQAQEEKLQLDAVTVYSADKTPPKMNTSFWARIKHEILACFYSFIIDYNEIGKVEAGTKGSKTITVWNGQGRDQANVIKALIDEEFTPETGIGVNLMLVDIQTLLPATVSGQGPDVAMQVDLSVPMNYGMRSAVYDLANFADLAGIEARFAPEILVPFKFEGHTFGLPETMTFAMMYYRKDILAELGIKLPETWDDFSETISMLSVNNVSFGMTPTPDGPYGMMYPQVFGMFLFQNGGAFYSDDYKRSALDSDVAVNSFKQMTKMYTDYRLELQLDFVNRFRTGEMPLGIADYTLYNNFQVFAPEIKGLWGFTSVPGTRRADGTIDKSVLFGGNAVVIMENAKDKGAAWEYLKWWTSAGTQSKYGREMEALMGSAARYPTANLEALANLPWPVEDYDALIGQMEYAKGYPQVPGGYYTGRYVNNAFYTVTVAKKIGAREALTDNVRYINEEIVYKRAEFGLEN